MRTEIIRSAKRKKTVQATVVDGVLQIRVPAYFDAATEAYWVDKMKERVQRTRACDEIDLTVRAGALASRHGLPAPQRISWSSRQNTLWGSCTPQTKTVRISERVASFPQWVVDYVIVHELAHLEIAAHSAAFWDLVGRYPKTERARGYLQAKAEGTAGMPHAPSGDDAADLLGDHGALVVGECGSAGDTEPVGEHGL